MTHMQPKDPEQLPDGRWVWHRNDLEYTIVAKPESWRVYFWIYEQISWGDDGSIWFWRKGYKGSGDETDNVDDAQPLACGHVKRLGEPFFEFQEQFYADGRKGLLELGQVLAACWDWTAELLDCADLLEH